MAKKILTTAIKQTKIIDKELVSKANNKFFTPPSSCNFDFLPQQENVNAFLNLCLQKCQCKIVFFFNFLWQQNGHLHHWQQNGHLGCRENSNMLFNGNFCLSKMIFLIILFY